MRLLLTAGVFALVVPAAASALTVTVTADANTLANAALAADSGITIQAGSTSLIGALTQQGTYTDFNKTNTSGVNRTIGDGVVLTTGTANFNTTTNTTNSFSVNSGTGAFAPLVALKPGSQSNANVLSFEFVLDDPTLNAVTGKFLFGTDEFPTQTVTDIMGIFVNGKNFAFFPNGDLVTNQPGNPNNFFTQNYPIEWNGLTSVFEFTALAFGGGTVNLIEIAISDTNDTIFDSALFFSGLKAGFTSGGGGIGPTDPNVIPLPAAAWFLLGGLGALGALRRRKAA